MPPDLSHPSRLTDLCDLLRYDARLTRRRAELAEAAADDLAAMVEPERAEVVARALVRLSLMTDAREKLDFDLVAVRRLWPWRRRVARLLAPWWPW